MTEEAVAVTIGQRAALTRRSLGPLAWSALEVLAAAPRPFNDRCLVAMSVRAIAGELGVAVNTAQRALRRLREAGLVEHAQRRADGGRFDAATYRLTVPNDVFIIEEAAPVFNRPSRSCRPGSSVASKSVPVLSQQLVLLPA